MERNEQELYEESIRTFRGIGYGALFSGLFWGVLIGGYHLLKAFGVF